MNIHCTTCGAMSFRRGVLKAMGRMARPRDWRYQYGAEEATMVVEALVHLEFDPSIPYEAVRMLLFDACAVLGESTVSERLGDSWADSVLRSMQEHYQAKVERQERHEAFNSQEAAAARKQAKDEARKLRLAERKAKKVEIDRAWRRG